MKKVLLLIMLVSFCTTIHAQQPMAHKPVQKTMDERFNLYKEQFIQQMWVVYPGWASSVGFHKYDTALIIPDERSRQKEREFCMRNLSALHSFKLEELSDLNKIDYHLLENQLNYSIFNIQEFRAFEWDPSTYNVSGGFAELLANDHMPLDRRLHSFYVKMEHVPEYYQAAKANIKNPTREHTDLAMEQNDGGLSVFGKDLEDALAKSKLPKEEKDKILARAAKATAAIKDYVQWLRRDGRDAKGRVDKKQSAQSQNGGRSFRIGKQLYDKKFAFEIQSGYTADQIYAKAVAHKEELHAKMYEITEQLWPKYLKGVRMPENKLQAIKMMIDTLSVKHVRPQDFQTTIEKQLPMLTNFIKKKDLIYIDPSKPLVVRREPDYMAGVAGASINAPGPYDRNGNTYYNVGSLDGWSAAKSESYLREYNHYILQILNIHEAIPGHYTQLVYANQSPSIIKSILGNNAMIEGWAVYTERMMLENGYDGDKGPDSDEASPEMWLMYYKWNLRSTCNTILDYDVHTKNLSQKDALKLLMEDAFQEKTEAMGKWKRVSVTQVQLCCYFTGYTEIYDLREEMKNKQKRKFDLKQFHTQFLSYGSAPVKYIKEMMMNSDEQPVLPNAEQEMMLREQKMKEARARSEMQQRERNEKMQKKILDMKKLQDEKKK